MAITPTEIEVHSLENQRLTIDLTFLLAFT